MWWLDVLVVLVVAAALYGFLKLTRLQTRILSRRTNRTAEQVYGPFADGPAKQRRYARRRGNWSDGE